jgi:hypothetical protein
VKVISDIKLSVEKILLFLMKGMKVEEDPFTPKRSLARSPTDMNRGWWHVTDTPGHYSEHNNYNTPIATKNILINQQQRRILIRRE